MARHLSILDYTYHLPEEKIASLPLFKRDESKLLVYKRGKIEDAEFIKLDKFLPENSLLVFNNTKVICARILFPISSKEKHVEIFILEPAGKLPIEKAMQQRGYARWICLVGNNREFKTKTLQKRFTENGKEYFIEVKKPIKTNDAFEVDFHWNEDLTFSEILGFAGLTPLPPYLKRELQESDKTRYQTIYAKEEGSVAAPTAGLHFTDEILSKLSARGHSFSELILHVGAGTFRPVKTATMEKHSMHNEELIVTGETLRALKNNINRIIAVGTTSLRTLESLFWLGLKLESGQETGLDVGQWDPYDLQVPEGFNYENAIDNLLRYIEITKLNSISAKTGLLIAPGYTIRSAKGLITNFHQPKSTLLLLVAAFIGNDWKRVYEHALANDYRFLSFGDSSLLLREVD